MEEDVRYIKWDHVEVIDKDSPLFGKKGVLVNIVHRPDPGLPDSAETTVAVTMDETKALETFTNSEGKSIPSQLKKL